MAMYILQWGLGLLFALTVLGLFFDLPDGFGLMLAAGWAGGFGTAAAVGTAYQGLGWDEATTLGFTSATVGVAVCIVGGLALIKWGTKAGKTGILGDFDRLPEELRTGLVSREEERENIGKATISPASIEPLAFSLCLVLAATMGGYYLAELGGTLLSGIAIPSFAIAFVVGLALRAVLTRTGAGHYVDRATLRGITGSTTDLLIAFGIASIVPSIVADYAVPLALLLLFGLVYCLLLFRYLTPRMFSEYWFERGIFTWGWATAPVATGIALLRIVDPKLESNTLEDFGVAFHLAERGSDVLVVDREGPAGGSTARSAALVRAHYPTALEADLAWESLTGYFERWGERVGGGCGFTRTGFAFLAAQKDAEKLVANVSMLKREVGVETDVLRAEGITEVDPTFAPDGVVVAAHEPRGGYADPTATTLGFLRAAQRLGARFERRRVTGVSERGGRITGVNTPEGTIGAKAVVLCSGAWSVGLAAGAGLTLPIRPARVQVALFERPYSLPKHLSFIDSVNEISGRPTADHCTLVGMRLSELEWLDDADRWRPEADEAFVRSAGRRVGLRLPALGGSYHRSGWAGGVDVTPDSRPILGPEGPEGLFLSVGWSGTGFKKAPAVGAELDRWVTGGAPRRDALAAYGLGRFETGDLIRGEHEYEAKTPH